MSAQLLLLPLNLKKTYMNASCLADSKDGASTRVWSGQVHGNLAHSHFVPGQLAPADIIFERSVQVSTLHELSHQHRVLTADTDAQEANNVLCPHLLQDGHLPSVTLIASEL